MTSSRRIPLSAWRCSRISAISASRLNRPATGCSTPPRHAQPTRCCSAARRSILNYVLSPICRTPLIPPTTLPLMTRWISVWSVCYFTHKARLLTIRLEVICHTTGDILAQQWLPDVLIEAGDKPYHWLCRDAVYEQMQEARDAIRLQTEAFQSFHHAA